jgi:glycosyltransferase involved in cell wall biosynthesis
VPCAEDEGAGRQRDARPRVAIVVQRYGPEITGGSESLARAVAERLLADYRVTVFTSCARDYVTWRNEMPEGLRRVGGVEVARFRAEEERDLDSFNRLSDQLYASPHGQPEELLWLKRQGPYVPRLVEQLEACKDRFVAILFFTYLYFPTYWGLTVAPERSILVPTAHDEPPLRLSIFESVFAAPRAFAFLTGPERDLVRSRFPLGDRPELVTGIGVDAGPEPDVGAFRIRHDVHGPYALYAGRIDAGKGCAEMLDHYDAYRRDCRGAAELLLVGKLAMELGRRPGVRYLGYLPEPEKRAALAGARAVICPSPYESLSIVLLEGMALGAPALASARSPVLLDHCLRSNGGLPYASRAEFVESLDLLVREEGLRRALGENGRAYVESQYRWDVVLARYKELIARVSESPGRARIVRGATRASE